MQNEFEITNKNKLLILNIILLRFSIFSFLVSFLFIFFPQIFQKTIITLENLLIDHESITIGLIKLKVGSRE